MSGDDLVAADIACDRAARIVWALQCCGDSLAKLAPASRLVVLRALCATFLEERAPTPGAGEEQGGST